MKKFLKRLQAKGFVGGFLLATMLASVVAVANTQTVTREITYGVNVMLHGQMVDFDNDSRPFVMDGRTFLPLRTLADMIDLPVDFDPATNTAILGTYTPTVSTSPGDVDIATSNHWDTVTGLWYFTSFTDNLQMPAGIGLDRLGRMTTTAMGGATLLLSIGERVDGQVTVAGIFTQYHAHWRTRPSTHSIEGTFSYVIGPNDNFMQIYTTYPSSGIGSNGSAELHFMITNDGAFTASVRTQPRW